MPQPSVKITGNAERIWRTVLAIPKGKVASYGQIADLAGLPGRARFVSRALGMAPDELALPWFRVLRSNGQLAFKAGSVMAREQSACLAEEQVPVIRNKVDMSVFGWKPDFGELLVVGEKHLLPLLEF